MTVAAQISQVQELSVGDSVGYGECWSAERAGRIGIVPVGYADGYRWRLGSRADALIEGRRVPVVGAVSMDMLAVDLGDSTGEEGSEVVLLGTQGEETIDAVELAERAGALVYEVLCGFGLRLPKVYTPTAGTSMWSAASSAIDRSRGRSLYRAGSLPVIRRKASR